MLENLRRSHQYRARSSRCTRYRTSGPVFSYSIGSKKVVYRLRGVYETSMSKFAGPELFSLHRSNKMHRCSRTGPLSGTAPRLQSSLAQSRWKDSPDSDQNRWAAGVRDTKSYKNFHLWDLIQKNTYRGFRVSTICGISRILKLQPPKSRISDPTVWGTFVEPSRKTNTTVGK